VLSHQPFLLTPDTRIDVRTTVHPPSLYTFHVLESVHEFFLLLSGIFLQSPDQTRFIDVSCFLGISCFPTVIFTTRDDYLLHSAHPLISDTSMEVMDNARALFYSIIFI
jgi:hypothetical protein